MKACRLRHRWPIGRRLNLPVVAKSPEEPGDYFGWLGFFVRIDCRALSALTRERLGWPSSLARLIPDLEHARDFEA
jgi:hypothetical protein